MYELLYSPLVAGVSYGSVAFLNPVAGEFWYELKLVAEAAVPVALPRLQAAVGGSVTHTFAVSNPTGDELPLRVTNSNARNFKIELAGGGALLLPPYGEVEAAVTYTPSAIEAEQEATLTLQHPKVRERACTALALALALTPPLGLALALTLTPTQGGRVGVHGDGGGPGARRDEDHRGRRAARPGGLGRGRGRGRGLGRGLGLGLALGSC